jgi:methylmalonyl-CoA/ethylmalonyl-CoA epimerase
MDRAVAFYRDVLGLTFMFQAPNVAFFDCAGQRLMLGQAQAGDPAPSGTVLYFDSAEIERDWDALKARGANAVTPPHIVAPMAGKNLWLAELKDPDDNVFALMQLR